MRTLLVLCCLLGWCLHGSEKADTSLVKAVEQVESGGKTNAIGDGGKAVGCLQIHPILVKDVNRILGKQKYTLKDRKNRQKSREMFKIYVNHYAKGKSDEVKARMWNGGPKGHKKKATLKYWKKVKKELAKQNSNANSEQ
jgi:type IV pilus biogenesis protein CpaD/CtpE